MALQKLWRYVVHQFELFVSETMIWLIPTLGFIMFFAGYFLFDVLGKPTNVSVIAGVIFGIFSAIFFYFVLTSRIEELKDAEPQILLEKAQEEKEKEDQCKKSVQCWGESQAFYAFSSCKERIEELAEFRFEWIDINFLERRFSAYRWLDEKNLTIVFSGDTIRMENKFGAWQIFTYECDYDTRNKILLAARIQPGRIKKASDQEKN
jgi:hypothetical protein